MDNNLIGIVTAFALGLILWNVMRVNKMDQDTRVLFGLCWAFVLVFFAVVTLTKMGYL